VNVFAFSALTLLVGRQEGHGYVWSEVQMICTDATATPSSLTPVNPEWLTFQVPAYPGCPGKMPLSRCSSSSSSSFIVNVQTFV